MSKNPPFLRRDTSLQRRFSVAKVHIFFIRTNFSQKHEFIAENYEQLSRFVRKNLEKQCVSCREHTARRP